MKESISLEIKQHRLPAMAIGDTKIIDGTGENGATFYPSVSADGVISWTNNKGLENPEPVNIKGKDGVDGKNGVDGKDGFSPDISVAEIPNGHRVTITDKDSVEHIDILNGADGKNGVDGVGIKSVQKTSTDGEFDTYTFNFTDGKTFSFTIKNGEDGADGRGISSIVKSSTNGLVDNYTINFTDGSKTTFSVTNGKNGVDGTDGKDGTPATHEWQGTRLVITSASGTSSADLKGDRGIQGIQGEKGDPFFISKVYNSVAEMHADYSNNDVKVGQFVVIDTGNVDDEDNAKLFYKGNTSYQFLIDLSGAQGMQGPAGVQGEQGERGPAGVQGVGIHSIAKTDTQGIRDIYTITLTNGSTATFSVTNGTNGNDGVSVTNAFIDSNGNLVISLSNGNELTLGKVVGSNGKDGADGTSVTITRVDENTSDGGVSTIFFSDGNSINIKNGATGGNGKDGANGTSVTIAKVSESTADGGSNVVTFSDGKTLTVKNGSKGSAGKDGTNGKDGADGYTPVKGTDYYTPAEKNEFSEYIVSELAKRGQVKPEFANSIDECTDTSKLYVLPDGYIYAYMAGSGTGQGSEELSVTWNDNYRLSTSDGGLRSGATGYTASDYIDLSVLANVGDTLSVTGLDFSTTNTSRSIVSKANGAFLAAYYPSTSSTHSIGNSGVTIKELKADNSIVLERISATADGKTYSVAFCGYGSGANAVVTRTGEVDIGGVMVWTSTGHAFVPADYEDRIVSLEASNKALKNDNASLKTRVKALEDAAVNDSGVPNYVLTEAEEVADKVLAVRNADSFVMALASDFHTNGEDISSVSVLHAGQGMNAINSMTQLDLVALLGDYEIYGFSYGDADTDGEDARKSFKHVKKVFSNVAKGVPFMQLQGNHDELPADTTEEAQQKYYAYIGANNVGTVTDYNNKFRNYGYRDFENYKIRVIYLNTADVSDGAVTGDYNVSAEQLTWLNTVALNLTDSEWGIIVLSHHPLNWYGMGNLLNALDEYKGKGEGAELIAHFHGHLHNFRAETLGTNSIPTITIPNACFGRNNEYGTSSSYSDDVKAAYGDTDENGNQRQFNKTENTAEDTAFNVVVVNRESRKIHCFNYGAGTDREISY